MSPELNGLRAEVNSVCTYGLIHTLLAMTEVSAVSRCLKAKTKRSPLPTSVAYLHFSQNPLGAQNYWNRFASRVFLMLHTCIEIVTGVFEKRDTLKGLFHHMVSPLVFCFCIVLVIFIVVAL